MAFFEVGGLTTAPTASANNSFVHLWNAGTASRLCLREAGFHVTAATTTMIAAKRTTTRGTQTATVTPTPTDPNDPASGAVLDTAWSAEPTKSGGFISWGNATNVIGAQMVFTWWRRAGLVIPTGRGVAFVTPTAAAGAALECWMIWEEN